MGRLVVVALIVTSAFGAFLMYRSAATVPTGPRRWPKGVYKPRNDIETSGNSVVAGNLKPWPREATLAEVAAEWDRAGFRGAEAIDRTLAEARLSPEETVNLIMQKAMMFNYEGEAERAYETLKQLRTMVENDPQLVVGALPTVVYYQGVTALRLGETENCVMCRGASSCILPIDPAAVHKFPRGSRWAIEHFTEYLREFPTDLEVRWLLNLAHMTLGEYPQKVDPRYLVSLDRFFKSEFDIGRFRDIGAEVGINRLNEAGGGILEDFDNDGLLDWTVTSDDPNQPMAIYKNTGDGKFVEVSKKAGVLDQLGALNAVQTDYNNDGFMDIFIHRGAWLHIPIRASLLKNNGDFTFTDVTEAAGLLDPVNSNTGAWADYDNDGWLDFFQCCEQQPNRLYHNKGDGTFEEVSARVGLGSSGKEFCKGACWVDYDNDDDPDLFVNNLGGEGRLFRNNGDGTFDEVTQELGITGPKHGFPCWSWDYDNDGWLDIWATSYSRASGDVVRGLIGQPYLSDANALFHNQGGKGFEDVTKAAGLDMVFTTMGSNFGDLDNDGYLDMYLGTGEPSYTALSPNRMFKNVDGKRFSDISVSTGTAHLQKGHGVAIGDWDRDGDNDIFVQMGGAVIGDKYHNILFQNPGQGNNWLTLKVHGVKTNRPGIGVRVKIVTAGPGAMTIHRVIGTGGSFGANPLQQTIGIGKADKIATLEIHWPTSKTTQTFTDLKVNQVVDVTEFETDFHELDWKPIKVVEAKSE